MSIKWKLKIIEWIVYSLHTYIAYKLITYFVPNNNFLFFISLAIIPATWSFSENKFLFPMKIQWLKYYIKNAMKNNENLNITFTQISQKNYQVTISVENQTLAEIFHKKNQK